MHILKLAHSHFADWHVYSMPEFWILILCFNLLEHLLEKLIAMISLTCCYNAYLSKKMPFDNNKIKKMRIMMKVENGIICPTDLDRKVAVRSLI